MAGEVTARQNQLAEKAASALEQAAAVITKSYLQNLTQYDIVKPSIDEMEINIAKCERFLRLTRLAENREEDVLDKLATIVNVVSAIDCTLAVVVRSDGTKADYDLGIIAKHHHRSTQAQQREADMRAFRGALSGNLIGSALHDLSEEETKQLRDSIRNTAHGGISAVSGVVSLRNDTDTAQNYVQGIENMVDALRGQKYTLVMIADPLKSSDLQAIRQGYEMLHTQLSVFRHSVLTLQDSQSASLSYAESHGFSDSISHSIALTQSRTRTSGRNFGMSAHAGVSFGIVGSVGGYAGVGVQGGWNKSNAETDGSTNTDSTNNTTSQQTTQGRQQSLSSGKSLQLTSDNRSIRSLLEQIDRQLERLDACESYGAFQCAAYVLTDDRASALTVAGNYNALMRGKNSCLQASQINTWYKPEDTALLGQYLADMLHPKFKIFEAGKQATIVTPASIISGTALAVQIGLPKKSIAGVIVVPMTPFGRNIEVPVGNAVQLGKLYHMGQEEYADVPLSVHSLASHTFITGSTGAGKSNTVYHLLDELDRQKVNFLVIEPAKGEYKNVFGGRKNVSVYGTNVKKAPLLRLNPFSFPEDTHVLEHIDRLVEIFNACWPMYAAMPAVLKDAVEQAYVKCGWSLTNSTNAANTFPTFADLKEVLPTVVQESQYSADTQSDYIGALVTRVKSLTNGINGQIFCSNDEISAEKLFDENVIVDLSRVGSMETKSLLMGVLVLKLQEHRMAGGDMNADLRHVTVLEEAHNLLRRTSDMQTQESSNLQGKSVEMIANAIAEMRTYGEGFIIADQAPGLMDPAVIRNTNTKIIMRLPDEGDRELVGKAASLNDDQIVELAKLPLGVAAVYQNDWLEPVLCKINRFEDGVAFDYQGPDETQPVNSRFFQWLLNDKAKWEPLNSEDVDWIHNWITKLHIGTDARKILLNALNTREHPDSQKLRFALYAAVGGKHIIATALKFDEVSEQRTYLNQQIREILRITEEQSDCVRNQLYWYIHSCQKENIRDRENIELRKALM
nr:ATP-binding protein [uncultured Agathobaculum sp.]